MEIKWSETRNLENIKVVRANCGSHWANFSYSSELLNVGEGTFCAPTSDELAQMLSESATVIDAMIATQVTPKSTMSVYRNRRTSFDNRIDMQSGANLSRAMDFEDSAF